MKLKTLQDNLSEKPRWPDNAALNYIFQNYNFFIYPEYKLEKLNNIPSVFADYMPSRRLRNLYSNLDYRMLSMYHKLELWLQGTIDLCNFIITDIDQNGIFMPIQKFYEAVHPGNKRLLIARYLNLDTVPILEQTKSTKPIKKTSYTQIKNQDEIISNFGNDISVQIRNKERLEISWHGLSSFRDDNGYDDWFRKSESRPSSCNYREYLLEYGLEVINPVSKKVLVNNNFVTDMKTKSPKNEVYIEVLDKDIMYQNFDFWELFFHIDPDIRIKECETKKIRIVNLTANSDKELFNCKLYNTLVRKKIKF